MSDVPPPPPPGGDPGEPRPPFPPVPPGPPGSGTPQPPPPGGYSQQPPPPGPPPGGYSPQPPPPGAQQFGTPPPAAYPQQPPAAAYQYGAALPSNAQLASMGTRIGGWLIDWLILAVVIVPLYFVLSLANTAAAPQFDNSSELNDVLRASGGNFVVGILIILLCTALWIGYHVVFVALKGQTPGAMAVKVKVVNLSDGQIPSWGDAFKRAIPNAVIVIPCCIGYLAILALYIWGLVNMSSNERRQTPFDLAGGTVVITTA